MYLPMVDMFDFVDPWDPELLEGYMKLFLDWLKY